jgi:chromosome segregation ATPase
MSGLLLSLVMGAAGYVGGRVHGWTTMRETQAQLQVAMDEHARAFDHASREHQAELAQLRAQAAEVKQKRARLEQRVRLQEGLRRANQAMRKLDERNFGDAQAALRAAEESISPLATAVQALPQVVRRVSKLNLVVAGNLGPQRQELSEVIDMLDTIVAREGTDQE